MDQATRDRILADYPSFSWLLDMPEVGGLLERAANEGWDITKLQGQLYATNWWRTTSESQRQFETLRATDPASADLTRVTTEAAMRREAGRLGMQLTNEEFLWLSTVAQNEGWGPADITEHLVRTGSRRDFGPGQARSTAAEIWSLSKQYGIPISSEWARYASAQIVAGGNTMEGIKTWFHEQAKWKYASSGNDQVVQGLDRGLTLWEVMQPTMSLVAEELEMDVNTFNLTEGLGSQLINYRDNETGQLRIMTESEAVQFARSQSQWRDTNRAKSEVTQVSDAITRRLGVRA